MKAILLAAGYATRLYPLTKDFPKPLLPVADKPIMTHLIEKIERVPAIEHVTVVTNHRFAGHFRAWRDTLKTRLAISVLDDGTTSNENRLGAVGDIAFALDRDPCDRNARARVAAERDALDGAACDRNANNRTQNSEEDFLVLAADNLFDFELSDFVAHFRNCAAVGADAAITVHELNDFEKLRRTGVAVLDQKGRVVDFVEKPEYPRSNLAVPPFYIYRSGLREWVRAYLAEGNNPDAPGHFLEWLVKRKTVYAYRFEGERYDIGNLESYRRTEEVFRTRLQGTGT